MAVPLTLSYPEQVHQNIPVNDYTAFWSNSSTQFHFLYSITVTNIGSFINAHPFLANMHSQNLMFLFVEGIALLSMIKSLVVSTLCVAEELAP